MEIQRNMLVAAAGAGTLLLAAAGLGGYEIGNTSSPSQQQALNGPAPITAEVRDSQCTPSETTCTMSFIEDETKDLDPLTGQIFGEPKPGLLAANANDVGLTNITAMPACPGTMPVGGFHNCRPTGYSSGGMQLNAPTFNNKTYFWDNCIVTNNMIFGPPVVPGLKIYLTNCHIRITGDKDGTGTLGSSAGGGMYYLHDYFDASTAPGVTHPIMFVNADAGVTSHVYYSEFSQNTDQARLMTSVDFEWNYMHNSRCDKGSNSSCVHTDGGPELYGGGNPAPDASHPIIVANNYSSCLCDSTAGPANITTDFGNNSYIYILNNKALPTYGSGFNNQGLIVQQNTGSSRTLTNVHVVGNTFFASSSHGPPQMGFGGSICRTILGPCITEMHDNFEVSSNGTISRWASEPAGLTGPTTTVSTTTTTSTSTTTLPPTTTINPPSTTTSAPLTTTLPATTTTLPPSTTSTTECLQHTTPRVCTVPG